MFVEVEQEFQPLPFAGEGLRAVAAVNGSVERIVSFVGVGLLMLIVGYVSPMPPARPVP